MVDVYTQHRIKQTGFVPMAYSIVLCDIAGNYTIADEVAVAFDWHRCEDGATLEQLVVDTGAKLVLVVAGEHQEPAFSLCQSAKQHTALESLPILLLLDHQDHDTRLRAFEVGFDDVLASALSDQ